MGTFRRAAKFLGERIIDRIGDWFLDTTHLLMVSPIFVAGALAVWHFFTIYTAAIVVVVGCIVILVGAFVPFMLERRQQTHPPATPLTLHFVEAAISLTEGFSEMVAQVTKIPAPMPWERISLSARIRCHNPTSERLAIQDFLVDIYTHAGKRSTAIPSIDITTIEGSTADGHGFDSLHPYSLPIPHADSFFRIRASLKHHQETITILNRHVVRVTVVLSDGALAWTDCRVDWNQARAHPSINTPAMPT